MKMNSKLTKGFGFLIISILIFTVSSCKKPNFDPGAAIYMPADSSVYLSFKIEDGPSLQAIQSILIKLNSSSDEEKEFISKLSANLDGGDISLAMKSLDFSKSDVPELYLAAKFKDKLMIEEFLSLLGSELIKSSLTDNLYQQETEDGTNYFLVKDDYLIVTNGEENIKEVLAVINGDRSSMAENETLLEGIQNIKPKDSLVGLAYIDFGFYQNLDLSGDLSADKIEGLNSLLATIQSEVIIIERPSQDQLQFTGYVKANEEVAKEIEFEFDSSSSKSYLSELISSEFLSVFAETHNLASQLDQFKKGLAMGSSDRQMANLNLSEKLNLSVANLEILGQVFENSEGNTAIAINGNPDKLIPELSIITELSKEIDRAQLSQSLKSLGQEIKTLIENKISESGFSMNINYYFIDEDEDTYFTINPDLTFLNLFLGLDTPPSFKLIVGVIGGNFVISNLENYGDISKSLANSSEYKSQMENSFKETPIFFLDFQNTSNYLAKVNNILGNETLTQLITILSNIQTIYGSNKAEKYESLSQLNIQFAENGLTNIVSQTADLIEKTIIKTKEEKISNDYSINNCNYDSENITYEKLNSITGMSIFNCFDPEQAITSDEFVNLISQTLYSVDSYIPTNETGLQIDANYWTVPGLMKAKNKGLIDDGFQAHESIKLKDAKDLLIATGYLKAEDIVVNSALTDEEILTYAAAAELINALSDGYWANYQSTEFNYEDYDYTAHYCNFTDTDWSSNYAEYLYSAGVIDRCFDENGPISNAEFIEFIVQAAYSTEIWSYKPSVDSPYPESLRPEHWAFRYIKIAYEQGALEGLDDLIADDAVTVNTALQIASNTGYLTKDELLTSVYDGKMPRENKTLNFKEAIKILYQINEAYWNSYFDNNSLSDELEGF